MFNRKNRFFEIIPGAISWSVIIFLIALFLINPLAASIIIIIYLMYWGCRLLYMSFLMIMAHYRIRSRRNIDWLKLCCETKRELSLEDIWHLVLYPNYKELPEILIDSLITLKNTCYAKEKIIVVLAGEEREPGSLEKLQSIRKQFENCFGDILITIHPQNVKKEMPCKGANTTYAAKKAKEYFDEKKIPIENVVASCFDADTRVDKNYLSCLTYHFIRMPLRYRTSFQPYPIYSNNIYTAPAFSRIIEIGSTFWQLVDSMRYEKFITFSSHSMSFKTLVEVDYWPIDLISDDSLIYWKCFMKFNGNYRTFPLEVPVFMDIAVGKNIFDTVRVQYKQKRRWAWGVENLAFLGMDFIRNKKISWWTKARKFSNIVENHVHWATWSIIVSFITPLILLWSKWVMKDSLVMFNLAYINSLIFNILSFIVILCIIMSQEFMPPRPKNVSRFIYVIFILQWLLIPFVSAVLGSFPALDAQTRLMLGKYLLFQPTLKRRKGSREERNG